MADIHQPIPGIHRVFISSTSQDLQAHRLAVHDILERMGQFAVDMAQFGAQSGGDAVEVSTDKVASADLYIGIVAWRYGYVPPRRKRSITHLEYLEAKRRGLPCLLFLAHPTTEYDETLFPTSVRDLDHAGQLKAFRAELEREWVVDYFATPDDLAKKVATALHGHVPHKQETATRVDLVATEAVYRKQVVEAYRHLRFSGFEKSDLMLDAVPLEKIFVRLSLTVEQVRRETTEAAMDTQLQERVVTVQESITLAEALKKPLLVVGEPGAGKSTLLRWLAVTFAQGTQQQPERIGPEAVTDRLPILVELGHLPAEYLQGEGGKSPNWTNLLPNLISEQEQFSSVPPSLLQHALAAGRCLVLFDGLDEVANRQARIRIARSLAVLPRLYPGATFVLGSRPAGLSDSDSVLRPSFQRCEIQRFTPEDLLRFFRFWYALDQTLPAEAQRHAADALYLQVAMTSGTLRLAATPLLATILLLIWRSEGTLPQRRVDLYERCCRALVENWEQNHAVAYRGIFANLGWEQHLRLLAPIAYTIHSHGERSSIGQDELQKLLEDSLQTEKLCMNPSAAGLEALHFLEALGLRSGLLQFQGDGRYGFPHLTFQEFLAARHIAAQPEPGPINLIMEHLHEAWWVEVHLLAIGRLETASDGPTQLSALLTKILTRYKPPYWLLESSSYWWLRILSPGRWFPGIQLERHLAWLLRREEMFALRSIAECSSDLLPPEQRVELRGWAVEVTYTMAIDYARWPLLYDWLQAQGRHLPPEITEAIAETLLLVLHNTDGQVRLQATELLGQLGHQNEEIIHALLERLYDIFRNVGQAAAKSLGQIANTNEEVVKTFLKCLHYPGFAMFAQTGDWGLMVRGNTKVLSTILSVMRDSNEDMRADATRIVGQMGISNEEVIQALLTGLQDAEARVRWAAVECLGQVGGGRQVEIKALLGALHDSDQWVRWEAVKSLGLVGGGNEEVLRALLKEWQNEKSIPIVQNLRLVGGRHKEVLRALLEALYDENIILREVAAGELNMWVSDGNEEVIQALLGALHDEMEAVRWTAAASLGGMGDGNEEVIQALLAALNDPNSNVRHVAGRSLGQIASGNEKLIQALLSARCNAEGKINWAIVATLGRVASESEAVLRVLMEALHEKDIKVREAAIESLGWMRISNPFHIRQVLVSLNRLLYDRNNVVREAALLAISQMLEGRAMPGAHWKPILSQYEHARRGKRIRLALAASLALFALILGLTWWSGTSPLDSSFTAFASAVALIAAIVQIFGVALRDLWHRNPGKTSK